VTDEYDFSGWGERRSSTGSTANSQQYKGRLLAYRRDPDAGPDEQYAMHHRNYDPKTATFTSADPAEDDSNLYRYVRNNPVNKDDPSGLEDYVDVRRVKASTELNAALFWANRYIDTESRIQGLKADIARSQRALDSYELVKDNYYYKGRPWPAQHRKLIHEKELLINALEMDLDHFSAKLASDFGNLDVPKLVVDYADDLTDYYFEGGSGGLGALQLATFLRSTGKKLGENYFPGGGLESCASPLDIVAAGGSVFVQNMLKGASIRIAAAQSAEEVAEEVAVEVVGPLALLRPNRVKRKLIDNGTTQDVGRIRSLLHPNDSLNKYREKIKPEPGEACEVVHADELGFQGVVGSKLVAMSPVDLAEYLKLKGVANRPIRLVACAAGKLDNGAASQVAKHLGVQVVAPTDIVDVFEDGSIAIRNNGRWRTFGPDGKPLD